MMAGSLISKDLASKRNPLYINIGGVVLVAILEDNIAAIDRNLAESAFSAAERAEILAERERRVRVLELVRLDPSINLYSAWYPAENEDDEESEDDEDGTERGAWH